MRSSLTLRRLLYTALATWALLAGPAHAQLKADLDLARHDVWAVWTAPAGGTAADWRTAALVAGGFGVLVPLDEPIDAWLRDHPGSAVHVVFGAFGGSSPLNLLGRTPYFLLPLSGTLYLLGRGADSPSLREAGLGCATANVTTTLSRVVVANLIGRLRPENERGAFVWQPFAGLGNWSMRSFPGGHAANAMACASYFSHRFELGVAEPLLYALATAVGLARTVDGAHWTSDTFVGMAHGHAVGKAVAARYAARARQEAAEQSMQPRLYIGWTITFD